MARIDIERKKKSIWPWIIGLLVLLLLIWGISEMSDGGDEARELPAATAPATTGDDAAATQPPP